VWALSLCGHKTGAFKHCKSASFQIDLCSDPYLWSWILSNDRKNINSGASTTLGIFEKSPRCDKKGVPRLGSPAARNKFGVSIFEPKLFWIKCPALKKKLGTLLRLFGGAQWFGVRGIVPPIYAPGVTLRYKVRSCEIRSVLNVEPLLNERIQEYIYVSSARYPECQTEDWWGKSCRLNPRESDAEVVQGLVGVTASPSLLGHVLVWSQQNYLKLLLTARYSKFSCGCCPRNPPQSKIGHESEWNE